MKYSNNTKFNIRLETVGGGMLTEFKSIKLDALLRWLKTAESDLETNYKKGNELLLNHTNSKTINPQPNDRL